MLVEWKEQRLLLATTTIIKKTTKATTPKLGKTIKILPGVNEIADNDWTAIESSLEGKIKSGTLVVYADDKGNEIKIDSMDSQDARDVIANCWSKKTLENLRADSKNAELRMAIDDQLKELDYLATNGKKRKK